jgi:hypothetical protein
MAPPLLLDETDGHLQFENECVPPALLMLTRFIVSLFANVTGDVVEEQLVCIEVPDPVTTQALSTMQHGLPSSVGQPTSQNS